VLEWRRPGGSDLAEIGQGSQAYLSLPPSCGGVSYSKAKQHGSHHSSGIREEEWGGVGIDESRGNRCSAQANESIFGCDGCGSLGQVVGAQGVLTQPGCVRGCSIPSLPLRYVGEMKLTWRGSYDVPGCREAEMDGSKALA